MSDFHEIASAIQEARDESGEADYSDDESGRRWAWPEVQHAFSPARGTRLPIYGERPRDSLRKAILDDPSFGAWLYERSFASPWMMQWIVGQLPDVDKRMVSDKEGDLDTAMEISSLLCFAGMAWFLDCETELPGLTANEAIAIFLAPCGADSIHDPKYGDRELVGEIHDALDLFVSQRMEDRGLSSIREPLEHKCLTVERTEMPAPSRPGVYFIQTRDKAGPIKIGVAKDVAARIRSIQTSHPWPLALLLVLDGDVTLEHSLHQRFASCRLHGEWFEASKPLLRFIAKAQEEAGL